MRKSIADIEAIRDRMRSEVFVRDNTDEHLETRVIVGMSTCGIQAGAREVFNAFLDEVAKTGMKKVKVMRAGCFGNCGAEPVVEVIPPDGNKVTYVHMTAEKAKTVFEKHVAGGVAVKEFTQE